MICRSADPYADFSRQDAEDYAMEKLHPICYECKERIVTEKFYTVKINRRYQTFCAHCVEEENTAEYVRERQAEEWGE